MLFHVLHKDKFSKYQKMNTTSSSKKTSRICHYGLNHRPEVINFMYPILLVTVHILQLFCFLCCFILFISIPLLLSRLLNVLYTYLPSNHAMLFHTHWECHKDILKQNYMYINHYTLKEIMNVCC